VSSVQLIAKRWPKSIYRYGDPLTLSLSLRLLSTPYNMFPRRVLDPKSSDRIAKLIKIIPCSSLFLTRLQNYQVLPFFGAVFFVHSSRFDKFPKVVFPSRYSAVALISPAGCFQSCLLGPGAPPVRIAKIPYRMRKEAQLQFIQCPTPFIPTSEFPPLLFEVAHF